MTRKTKSDPALSGDRKLSVLEAELAKVTEEFRLAKLAAREAKAYAKVIKKQMKRVRRAWVAAQEELDQAISATTRKKALTAPSSKARAEPKPAAESKAKRRVAESPETVRKPRPKKKQPALVTAANVTGDSPAAESAVAPANEPELDRDISDTTVRPEE